MNSHVHDAERQDAGLLVIPDTTDNVIAEGSKPGMRVSGF